VLFHDYTLVAGAGKTSNEEMKTYVKPYINSTLLEVHRTLPRIGVLLGSFEGRRRFITMSSRDMSVSRVLSLGTMPICCLVKSSQVLGS
jgi:hypothetical protein